MNLLPQHRIVAVPAMLALALVAGCSKHENNGNVRNAGNAAAQVVVKVNATEITVTQLNNVLARSPKVAPEAAERARREILNQLIDAELARQEAVGKGFDRSPAVIQAFEAAKTEILARAYAEKVAAAQPKPTAGEVRKYFAEHPELFSERHVYSIEEISIPATEGLAARLRDALPKAPSLQNITEWLKSLEIQFTVNNSVRAAEQIPLALLASLQQMKDGEIQVFEEAGGLHVIRVAARKLAAVDEVHAAPRIQQFLFGQRSAEAIAASLKQLREKAKIEYVGAFVASAGAAEAKARRADSKVDQPQQPLTPEMEKGLRGVIR